MFWYSISLRPPDDWGLDDFVPLAMPIVLFGLCLFLRRKGELR